jgi:hypothetical protein
VLYSATFVGGQSSEISLPPVALIFVGASISLFAREFWRRYPRIYADMMGEARAQSKVFRAFVAVWSASVFLIGLTTTVSATVRLFL